MLDEHDRYYELVLRAARDGIAAGRSPLEAARDADLGPFSAWADAERIVLNLHRAYDELGGRDFDVLRSIEDAMEWNGGPMTTHVCCWPLPRDRADRARSGRPTRGAPTPDAAGPGTAGAAVRCGP